MEYTKLADGIKLIPKYETCQLQECIRTVLHCLPSSQVRVCPLPTAMCPFVLTDKQWFQENILCLLSNAVKFSPVGFIDLKLSLIRSDGSSVANTTMPFNPKAGYMSMDPTVALSFSAGQSTKIATSSKLSGYCTMVMVEIEDQGVGIPLELHSKLFCPFQQAQKNAGGTGLGLYSLSKRVEALGGRYGVKNRPDGRQGSLFWFSFPYRPDTITASMMKYSLSTPNLATKNDPNPQDKERTKSISYNQTNDRLITTPFALSPSRLSRTLLPFASLRSDNPYSRDISLISSCEEEIDLECNHTKYRILLADDSTTIRTVLVKILQHGGHEVTAVSNGLEVLNKLESVECSDECGHFDVVIVDLHMPVLDGLETIRRIREKEHQQDFFHRHIILGCSANDDAQTVSEFKTIGANDVLSKPFSLQHFDECMKHLLT